MVIVQYDDVDGLDTIYYYAIAEVYYVTTIHM